MAADSAKSKLSAALSTDLSSKVMLFALAVFVNLHSCDLSTHFLRTLGVTATAAVMVMNFEHF